MLPAKGLASQIVILSGHQYLGAKGFEFMVFWVVPDSGFNLLNPSELCQLSALSPLGSTGWVSFSQIKNWQSQEETAYCHQLPYIAQLAVTSKSDLGVQERAKQGSQLRRDPEHQRNPMQQGFPEEKCVGLSLEGRVCNSIPLI